MKRIAELEKAKSVNSSWAIGDAVKKEKGQRELGNSKVWAGKSVSNRFLDSFLTSFLRTLALTNTWSTETYPHPMGRTMTQDIAEPQAEDRNGVADAMPTAETVAAPGDISAREAVRRAVAELGPDAELDDVIAHLQSKYSTHNYRY
jgi:hypothetical protein